MASKKMVLSVFIVFLMAFAVVASGCLGGGGSSSTTTSSPSATSSSSPSQSTTSSPSATSSPTTTTVSPTKVVQYVGDHLSNATVVETPNYVVIVGPEGSGAKVSNLPPVSVRLKELTCPWHGDGAHANSINNSQFDTR